MGQRLFGAGLNGEITEYDLENLRSRYTVEAYGGPIWTIGSNSQGTLLTVSQDLVDIVFTLRLNPSTQTNVSSVRVGVRSVI